MIADDAMVTREGIARLLGEAGVEVVGQAEDATRLLHRVAAEKPDVAIVDIKMPPTHTDEGIVAAQRIRGEFPDVGVLVLSSVPAGTGHEASVTNNAIERTAFGLEFAGATTGLTANMVHCGLGNPGECQTGGSTGFVALIQRGTLDFATKVTNAKAQGAAAAVIYNNAAGDFTGTLGAAGSWVPAVSVSDAAGAALEARVGTSTTVVNKVSNWDYYDGTSMATPHTSAVVALIWSANPTMTANNVETTLKNNCDDLGAAGYDTTYGYGRINADRALAATGH